MFSGQTTPKNKNVLKCGFEATSQPNVTIETAKGMILPSRVLKKKAKQYRYNAELKISFTWKLENAGNVSCRVYYENSNVEATAQATVNSKNSYKKIHIQGLNQIYVYIAQFILLSSKVQVTIQICSKIFKYLSALLQDILRLKFFGKKV